MIAAAVLAVLGGPGQVSGIAWAAEGQADPGTEERTLSANTSSVSPTILPEQTKASRGSGTASGSVSAVSSGPTDSAQAAGTAPAPSNAPIASVPTGTVPEVPGTFVDVFHDEVSAGLLTTAVWLDSFFGDERYEAESNDSHFKVRDTVLFEDGNWTRYRPDYELRLVLPQLRKKTRLVISGDMWDNTDSTAGPSIEPPLTTTSSEDRQLNTSLQVVLPSHQRHSTTIRGGLKYHSGHMVYYAGPRYRYLRPLDSWNGRFIEDVVWGTENGWESKTRFDLERPLPYDLFFRASAEGDWTQGTNGYNYYYTFLLRQPLDFKRAVEYEWVNSCHTRPANELYEVKFIFRYRQQIWRRWLFFEIAPQYRFPKDRSFEATPGINFTLEMVFSR